MGLDTGRMLRCIQTSFIMIRVARYIIGYVLIVVKNNILSFRFTVEFIDKISTLSISTTYIIFYPNFQKLIIQDGLIIAVISKSTDFIPPSILIVRYSKENLKSISIAAKSDNILIGNTVHSYV